MVKAWPTSRGWMLNPAAALLKESDVIARVFKTRRFSRWASQEGLTDADLCRAVREMEAGLIDANLGGGVYKKRVSLAGRGKRGGARTLIATNLADRWIFIFGFAKNEMENVRPKKLADLKDYAQGWLSCSVRDLYESVSFGELEVINDECREQTP